MVSTPSVGESGTTWTIVAVGDESNMYLTTDTGKFIVCYPFLLLFN